MTLSGLSGVRWIVEDALRFVRREVRRGRRYRGILLLDPPAYGRGANGEKWVLEDNLCEMLECCAQLLEPRGLLPRAQPLLHGALLDAGGPHGRAPGFRRLRRASSGARALCFEDRAGKTTAAGHLLPHDAVAHPLQDAAGIPIVGCRPFRRAACVTRPGGAGCGRSVRHRSGGLRASPEASAARATAGATMPEQAPVEALGMRYSGAEGERRQPV